MVAYLTTARARGHDEPVDIPDDMRATADEYHDKLMDVVVRDLRRADGALPRGRRDQPRGDGGGAEEARHRGRALPGRLRRGDAQHRLARPARPDRRGAAVARFGRRTCPRSATRARVAYVFKTIADPFSGKLNLLRVFAGDGQVRLDARQQPQPHARSGSGSCSPSRARSTRRSRRWARARSAPSPSSRRPGPATCSPTPTRPPTSSRSACPRRSCRSRSSRSTRATRRRS